MAIIPEGYENWIKEALLEKEDLLFGSMIRGSGKSVFMKTFPLMPLTGSEFTGIYMDELSGPIADFSFHNDSYPLARVDIFSETLKNDPRNPNPAAGKRKVFYIIAGGKRVGGEYASLSMAKVFAEPMHKKMVKALEDDLQKNNPTFGVF